MSVPASSSMAPVQWSNLHPDILSILAKFLNTDVDILRIRSVCTSWRSSVPRRLRPSPFPLKVPPLFSDCEFRTLRKSGHYFLNYTTLYRLSPPKHGPHAGDLSDGWLFRVSEVNPNRISLLTPLAPTNKVQFPNNTIPKYVNLLDYRISEVSKCYSLKFVDAKGNGTDALKLNVKKVIVLLNYAVDFDFVVLVLFSDRCMSYWKFGDMDWTKIDTMCYDLTDVVFFKGKCYAIGIEGVLLSFDSKLNLTAVPFPHIPVRSHLPVNCYESDNYLVEFKSNLYAASKILQRTGSDEDESCVEENMNEIPLRFEIFKKCDDWKHIRLSAMIWEMRCS